MPGSGKTTLAAALAPVLGFSLVSKDHIKEALFDALAGPAGDLAFSRQIGGAAMAVLWSIAERSANVVLEANFRPHSAYERQRLEALQADLVEVFCERKPLVALRLARSAVVIPHTHSLNCQLTSPRNTTCRWASATYYESAPWRRLTSLF